jgi:hypothetical protein
MGTTAVRNYLPNHVTQMDNKYLSKIFEGGNTGNPLNEILSLSSTICPDANHLLIRDTYNDLTDFFSGSHPFFQKNTLQYHNLRHTQMVALATVRMFHGLHCNHIHIKPETLNKGLLSAYFHDTGMLLVEGDHAQSGTEYIVNHEKRSILFLQRYIALKNLDPSILNDCATIIRYTNLSLDPQTFANHSHETQLAGQVVGSADILAQMADRYYLEALPTLHEELKADETYKHASALDLMIHTASFYRNIILNRLVHTFSNTSQSMQTHFRERYQINRDLYTENIDKNIAYLEEIITKCKSEMSSIQKFLKRKPPVT